MHTLTHTHYTAMSSIMAMNCIFAKISSRFAVENLTPKASLWFIATINSSFYQRNFLWTKLLYNEIFG